MRLYLLMVAILACDVQSADVGHRRDKRFALTGGCRMNPENLETKVIPERQPVTLECTYDTEPVSCIWTHNEPMNEGINQGTPDISCTAGQAESGRTCNDDTRVQFASSGSRCAITITDTKPEDTGSWKLNAVGLSNTAVASTVSSDFRLYTYNRSTIAMLDESLRDITNGQASTTYNRNTRQNQWETGKSNWERVEFNCKTWGGRPTPVVKWYLENKDNEDLRDLKDLFKITDTNRYECADRNSYICNSQSNIEFTIDDKLMEHLRKIGVDINPKDNMVRFDLNCNADQGTSASSVTIERVGVELQVQKRYDNGQLSSDTIGIIVGCIVAAIVLVIAIAIVMYARATNRWCWADEYEYSDPREQKHPKSVSGGHRESRSGGGGGHHQQQQVHSSDRTDRDKSPSSSTPLRKPDRHSSPDPSKSSKSTSKSTNKPPSSSSGATPKLRKDDWIDSPAPSSQAKSAKKSTSSSTSSSTGAIPKTHKGEWVTPLPTAAASSTTTSTRSDNETPPPPQRPKKKPQELEYANLDRRSFMMDPRNKVLPKDVLVPRPSPTQYASLASGSKLV